MELIRKLLNRIKNQKGVTLIELLAVIVILGIIAAIGIPAIVDSRDEAERATFAANAKTMTETVKQKMLFNEVYAETITADANEFNLMEVVNELGIPVANVDNETATADTVTLDVISGGEQIGTYTLTLDTGVVVYTEN